MKIPITTIAIIVLLRLAIGWHFFVEGGLKVRSQEGVKPFSSEAYFRESQGPLGDTFRKQLGDPDLAALERLTLKPGYDRAEQVKLGDYLPAVVAAEYDDYAARFKEAFKLDGAAGKLVDAQLAEAKQALGLWLARGTGKVKRSMANQPDVEVTMSTPDRVAEYRQKLDAVKEIVGERNYVFGKSMDKAAVPSAKADVTKVRASLLADLDDRFAAFKKALAGIRKLGLPAVAVPLPAEAPDAVLAGMLTLQPAPKPELEKFARPERAADTLAKHWQGVADAYAALYGWDDGVKNDAIGKREAAQATLVRKLLDQNANTGTPLPEPGLGAKAAEYRKRVAAGVPTPVPADLVRTRNELKAEIDAVGQTFQEALDGLVTPAMSEPPTPKAEKAKTLIEQMDIATGWTLFLAGLCLLLGLGTRFAALVAAGFLLMTYLAQPPFPWLPAAPNNEGNYAFVNKNVVEMFALLVIASLPTGRWLGLDGLIVRLVTGGKPRAERPSATPTKKRA